MSENEKNVNQNSLHNKCKIIYDIECDVSLDDLIKSVNRRLKKGWQLQGGVATISKNENYSVFYQAMYKEING